MLSEDVVLTDLEKRLIALDESTQDRDAQLLSKDNALINLEQKLNQSENVRKAFDYSILDLEMNIYSKD